MKSRPPTVEERRLWREVNHTTRRSKTAREEIPDEVPEPHIAATKSSGNTHSIAPVTSRKAPTTPLPQLTLREANKRFKSFPIEATLDLHGTTKLEAREKVQQFLRQQHRTQRRHVVIITGKGKDGEVGVLRACLPDWLNEAPTRALVSAFATARPEKGGTGVTHVLLKAR